MARNQISKLLLTLLFIVLGITERVIFDLGPNIELVTVSLLFTVYYIGLRYSISAVLVILVISDLIIGNTNIYLFTYSGFLIPALIIGGVFAKKIYKGFKMITLATSCGIGTGVFFYIWTNFGVWLLDSYGMYPKTLVGLLNSYYNGIPFLKLNLISTLLIVPAVFFISEVFILTYPYLSSRFHHRLFRPN